MQLSDREFRATLGMPQVNEILSRITDGYLLLDSNWVILHCCEKVVRYCRKTRAEMAGKILWDVCPQVKGQTFEQECRQAEAEETGAVFESFFPSPETWFEVTAIPTAGGLLLSLHDITRRRLAEQRVRDNQERLAGIISSAMDAIITVDSSNKITLFNAAAEKMFGCPASRAVGRSLDLFIPERYRANHHGHMVRFGKTSVTRRTMGSLGAVWGLRANGEEFPIEASISHVESSGQKQFTVILRDITERKKAEERLVEQAALLNLAQDAIVVRSLDDCILFWNKSAERLYGWSAEEAIGQSALQLAWRENVGEYQAARRQALHKGTWAGEASQLARDGRRLVVDSVWTVVHDSAGNPKSILAINTDITEKKRLEAQFLRAQRMESIGTLASGIAHDLNNVLSPILMAVQMLQLKVEDKQARKLLEVMRTNAERGADMIKQVLSFARGAEGDRVALQLKHLIREIVKILKETLDRNIQISFRIAEDLWVISGDATQLHQVLMNLCINARDAMPEGGQLTIEAENRILDETYSQMMLDARPGRYVLLTVTDTGTGIAPDQINRIFDPFYTTKEPGRGTGLGLSTVMGIVKGHGGFVNVYSEIGKGTQFKIHLPAIEAAQLLQSDVPHAALPQGHGELILVVDDEMAIREVTRATLEAFNYRVLTANDGAEAIAQFAQHQKEIRVVLTDMMMPYMDGPTLIRALLHINPQVRIIASSGLPENGKAAEIAGQGVKVFLSKPYTADKLLRALADVLTVD